MKYKKLIHLYVGIICNATTTQENLPEVFLKIIQNAENINNNHSANLKKDNSKFSSRTTNSQKKYIYDD